MIAVAIILFIINLTQIYEKKSDRLKASAVPNLCCNMLMIAIKYYIPPLCDISYHSFP